MRCHLNFLHGVGYPDKTHSLVFEQLSLEKQVQHHHLTLVAYFFYPLFLVIIMYLIFEHQLIKLSVKYLRYVICITCN